MEQNKIDSLAQALEAQTEQLQKATLKIGQFEDLMKGAKDTQTRLAREISQIMEMQSQLNRMVSEKFEAWEKALDPIRATQKTLASEISSILEKLG